MGRPFGIADAIRRVSGDWGEAMDTLKNIFKATLILLALSVPGWGASTIQGVVYESTGRPAGGAGVYLRGLENFNWISVTAAADGSYALYDVPEDFYRLTADSSGTLESRALVAGVQGSITINEDIWLASDGDTDTVDLALNLVSDDGLDTPLSGLTVILAGPGGVMGDMVDGGPVPFGRIKPGTYAVYAKDATHLLQGTAIAVTATGTVTLRLATVAGDPSAGLVVGMVRDQAGRACSGVQVVLQGGFGTRTIQTGADGVYAFTEIPAGELSIKLVDGGQAVQSEGLGSAAGAFISSLRLQRVPAAVETAGDRFGRGPQVYRSADRQTAFFDAGTASSSLKVRVLTPTGQELASLTANRAGEVLAMGVGQWGQGVYLAAFEYNDGQGAAVRKIQKFVVSR